MKRLLARLPRRAGLVVAPVLLAQTAALLTITAAVYSSGNLSLDYAIFNQAWYRMAHGHLDPTSTLYGTSYLHQHGELIMLLLAPLWWLNGNEGLTLLVIQDLAIVGCVAVAAAWVVAYARRRDLDARVTAGCVALVLILCLAHPWIWAIAYEDFHFEALAVLLALAAGFDLWRGHGWRAAAWTVLGLLTGDVAAAYLLTIGLGLAAAAPGVRRRGLALVGGGLAWVAVLAAAGANQASPIDGYAYLAGRSHVGHGPGGFASLAGGALLHPGRLVHRLRAASQAIGHNFLPSGTLGLLEALTVVPLVLIGGSTALNSEPVFAGVPFQNLALYVLCPLGCGLLCARLAARRDRRSQVAAVVVAAVAAVSALAYDVPKLAAGAPVRSSLPTGAGAQLAAARRLVPGTAEVVASYGIVGRFSSRRWVYAVFGPGGRYPVHADVVAFVIAPTLGVHQLPAGTAPADQRYLTTSLHARAAYSGTLVHVYLWRPEVAPPAVALP